MWGNCLSQGGHMKIHALRELWARQTSSLTVRVKAVFNSNGGAGGTKKTLCFMLLFRGSGIKKPTNQYLGLWSLLLTSKLLSGHWHCCCVACVYVYFNFFLNIGVKLFNKTVIVSDIHVSILPQTPFPSRLPHNIKQSSLYYTVGLCWLSILSIAVCTCPSQTPYRYPPFPLAIISLCCFFTMDNSCSGYSLGLNQYPLQKGTIY